MQEECSVPCICYGEGGGALSAPSLSFFVIKQLNVWLLSRLCSPKSASADQLCKWCSRMSQIYYCETTTMKSLGVWHRNWIVDPTAKTGSTIEVRKGCCSPVRRSGPPRNLHCPPPLTAACSLNTVRRRRRILSSPAEHFAPSLRTAERRLVGASK
jgi:hypothetical protein